MAQHHACFGEQLLKKTLDEHEGGVVRGKHMRILCRWWFMYESTGNVVDDIGSH